VTVSSTYPRAHDSGHRSVRPLSGAAASASPLRKKPTGVIGFDEITEGGLPTEGVTAIIGDAGSGKTVFALQTIVHGLRERGERGILVAFEEPVSQIRRNFATFNWGFADIDEDQIRLIDARLPVDVVRSGAFDLSGILAVVSACISETGACNVAFDGLDVLLSALHDDVLERQEITRLGEWAQEADVSVLLTVKSHGVTDREQERANLLQYVTDCVVVFHSHMTATSFSRTIRVQKYRGSGFAANPLPFVIGASGVEVVGFRGTRISHPTFSERVSTGVPRLDDLLDGGYIRGSCTLVSGAPGTSKTSLGASLLAAACERGQRSLLVSFDESSDQIISNMKSIGLDLAKHVESGVLGMESLLSASRSPEEHFVIIRRLIDEQCPEFLVIDPLSALLKMQLPFAEMVCERLLDQAKSLGISVLCTSLLDNVNGTGEVSASHVSMVADTWIHVSYLAHQGERNRSLTIIKSRGTAHSNQVSELVLGPGGIEIVDVYSAEGEVLMGSARHQKLAIDRREHLRDDVVDQRKRFEIDKSIAELTSMAARAVQDLDWKNREAKLLGLDEKAVRENAQTDADERLSFRND
jgi:circadian clock protein KaiC